jgi:NADH-quinone oxidoreductase subunit G
LRQALFKTYPHLMRIGQIASADAGDLQKLAALGGTADKAPFSAGVDDFYFTNAIARCSAVMAECSALALGRSTMTAAE